MGIFRTDIEINELSNPARNYLALPPTIGLKGSITIFTLLFVNFFGAFILITDPFIESLLWLTYPFIILFNLWFVTLLIRNVYSIQMEGLLFVVVTCFLSVYLYLIIIYKMGYFIFQFDSPVFMILVLLSVFLEVIYFSIYYYRLIHQRDKKKDHSTENKFSSYIFSILYSFPAFGYIFYQAIIKQAGLIEYALLFCYLFFIAFLTFLGTKNGYKYLFLRANPSLIMYERPPKSEWAEMKKKGIVIK